MSDTDDDTPTVTLAGKPFPVHPLAFRALSKIMPIVSDVFTVGGMSEASLQALAKVVYYGIKSGAPDLTLDALMDMPISIDEMSAAALVVCQRAGLKKKESVPGEAAGLTKPRISEN